MNQHAKYLGQTSFISKVIIQAVTVISNINNYNNNNNNNKVSP